MLKKTVTSITSSFADLSFISPPPKERPQSAPRSRPSPGSTFSLENNPTPDRIRAQGILQLLKKDALPNPDIMCNIASRMASIKPTGEHGPGQFGGVLISPNVVLTVRHGIVGRTQTVTFRNYERPDILSCTHDDLDAHIYSGEVVSIDSNLARGLGIHAGPTSDLVLIQLDKQESDFPTHHSNISPLPEETHPGPLIHFGFYKGAKVLKVSKADTRTIDIKSALEKGIPLEGSRVSWAGYTNYGIITTIERQSEDTLLTVESNKDTGRSHQFLVKSSGVFKRFGTGDKPSDLCAESVILIGHDHVILGHKTGPGGSGGIYVTEDGSFYAMNIGEIDSTLFTSDPDRHFKNHIAIFPGVSFTSTFLNPFITEESKHSLELKLWDILAILEKDITDIDPTLIPGRSIELNDEFFGYIETSFLDKKGLLRLRIVNENGELKGNLCFDPELNIVGLRDPNKQITHPNASLVTCKARYWERPNLQLYCDRSVTEHHKNKVSLTWIPTPKSSTISGIGESALTHYKDQDQLLLLRFEDFINSKLALYTEFTNGSTNTPLLPNIELLRDIIGHTGVSVTATNCNKKYSKYVTQAKGSDVKLYLDSCTRAVYSYDSTSKTLNYHRGLSLAATH